MIVMMRSWLTGGSEMIHYTTVNVYHSSPSQTFLDSRGEVRASKSQCDCHTNAGSNLAQSQPLLCVITP